MSPILVGSYFNKFHKNSDSANKYTPHEVSGVNINVVLATTAQESTTYPQDAVHGTDNNIHWKY
jgi:hypothetical protein